MIITQEIKVWLAINHSLIIKNLVRLLVKVFLRFDFKSISENNSL